MTLSLSVIICTHNPRPDYLQRVLDALRTQTLPLNQWELLIVDNASTTALADHWDVSWHPNGRHVREQELGLTHARLRGYKETSAPVIVYVDDDNVLDADYLREALSAMEADPTLGAAGGRVVGEFEVQPPDWLDRSGVGLALQDLGDKPLLFSWIGVEPNRRKFPGGSPNGAGIVLRRAAYETYVKEAADSALRLALGRKGGSLASCEDNDVVLTIMTHGFRSAYLPQLNLIHLIAAKRLEYTYLSNLGYSANRTWYILHHIHGIAFEPPMPRWKAPAAKFRAFFQHKAWRRGPSHLQWRQRCGQIDGRADIYTARTA